MVSTALFAPFLAPDIQTRNIPKENEVNSEEKHDLLRRTNRLKPLSTLRVSLTSIQQSAVLPLSNRNILIMLHSNEKHRVKVLFLLVCSFHFFRLFNGLITRFIRLIQHLDMKLLVIISLLMAFRGCPLVGKLVRSNQ